MREVDLGNGTTLVDDADELREADAQTVEPKPRGGPENARARNRRAWLFCPAGQACEVTVTIGGVTRKLFVSTTKEDTALRLDLRAISGLPKPDFDKKRGLDTLSGKDKEASLA